MAGRLSSAWPAHLEELLESLRRDGFRLGVAETLRLEQLLLALMERGVPLDDPRRLAGLLGPVVCRSASEQEAFRRHLAHWWEGVVDAHASATALREEPDHAPAAALGEALEGVERRRQRWLRWLPTTPLGLALAGGLAAGVVVVAGGGGVWLWQRLSPAPRAQAPATPAAPTPRAPTPPPAAPTPAIPGGAPAAPRPREAPLALAREEGVFLLPGELVLLLAIGALLALAAVQAGVRGWWWRQARLVLERLPARGELQLHRIALAAIEPELLALPDAQHLARSLNRWRRVPSTELDGAATVAESLRKGGWLTPRHGVRRERLSWLFLLDQESLADQQTRHLRAWLERLREEGVLAEWACFQRQPLLCHGPEGLGPRRGLAELAALHPDAVAVVVADGERFFSPVDGTPQPWLEAFAAWPRRAALTPRPRALWGATEEELGGLVPLLPVSAEGLRALGQLGETAATPDWRPVPGPTPPEPELLREGSSLWLERNPPAPPLIRQLLEQLRGSLGEEGFTWLAACAVFPELHWTITAYLGQRLQSASGEPLLKACPLLRLARLPWFRHGFMPDWLRLPLILSLPPERQNAVRSALRELLLSAVEGGEVGAAQLTVATERARRLPRLLPPLLELLRQRGGATSPLRDHLFLRFLQDRPLLAADAPESLRRLAPEGMASPWPWRPLWSLGPRGLVAAGLLLLGAAALSVVVVKQAQLAWVDRLVEAGDGGSGPPAALRLQRAITAFGLSRTGLMRLGPDPELGRVEGALAAGLAQPGVDVMRLNGHQGHVFSVAFSPDGRRIVSGSWDTTLRLWDAATGLSIGAPLRGHADAVNSVAFSPDGRRLVSGSYDTTLRLWDAATGQPIGAPLKGHTASVFSVAYSPDGRRLVSGSADNTLRLWDATTGQPIGSPLQGHTNAVMSVAFSPDGRRLVSGSTDTTLRLWDAATGQPLGSPLRGHADAVLSVAISPDGRRLVSGSSDRSLRFWDAGTGQPIGAPLPGHANGVISVAFSPDGKHLVSGSSDRSLRLWDAATGQVMGAPLQGHANAVISAAFSPDGKRLVSGSTDNTLRVWDAAADDGMVAGLKPLAGQLGQPIATGQGAVLSLIELKNGEVISGGADGTLRRWRDGKAVGDGKPIATDQGPVWSLIELKNGEVISGGADGTLRRWREGKAVGDGQPIATGQGGVRSLIELRNGEVISGGFDGTLRRWREGKPVGDGQPIATGQGGILSLIELKNGEVISGGFDGTLRRWREGKAVGDGQPIATGQRGVTSLIELRNGEVISGGFDGTLRRWREGKAVGDGQPIATGQERLSSQIALKNGELISGGEDGTLRRWRDGKAVGDGKPIATGQGGVWSLIELKNGEVISGGMDGTLRRWRSTPGWRTLLPLACAKLDHHPALTSLPWLNSARATCQHFVWRHQAVQSRKK